jgi:putative cardiolipin synthase
LRYEPGPARKRQLPAGSKAGLHTKTMVFDRKDVFIGSFNLDARSSTINTEAGLYVESPDLAAQVVEYLAEGAGPEVRYRVLMDNNGELLLERIGRRQPAAIRYRFALNTRAVLQAQFWKIMPIPRATLRRRERCWVPEGGTRGPRRFGPCRLPQRRC